MTWRVTAEDEAGFRRAFMVEAGSAAEAITTLRRSRPEMEFVLRVERIEKEN